MTASQRVPFLPYLRLRRQIQKLRLAIKTTTPSTILSRLLW
jgi:hypothetical protein